MNRLKIEKCKQCGKEFQQNRSWQIFCSAKCRDAYHGFHQNTINGIQMSHYIWEMVNGPVPKGAVIHHINGNHYDNHIDNLQLFLLPGDHVKLHAKENHEKYIYSPNKLRKRIQD